MEIGKTGVSMAAPVRVESAGNGGGDFARIWLGGHQIGADQIGYNLVALDSAGTFLGNATFNTFASDDASTDLAAWVARWPLGTAIAGAVRDEASYRLAQSAVDALRSLGVATDLRGRFRASHAFVGAVGAAPGTALEAFDSFQAVSVAVGPGLDTPFISAGIGHIQINPLRGRSEP